MKGPGPGPGKRDGRTGPGTRIMGRDHGPGSMQAKAKKLQATGTNGTPTPRKKIVFQTGAGCAKPGYNLTTLCI